MKLVDLEAHFLTPELARERWSGADGGRLQEILLDTGEGRIRAMDDAGITVQTLSVVAPVQMLEPAEATVWSRKINDAMAAVVKSHPDRFIGLAAIAPQDPQEAAVEIERAVRDLGLHGVSILSHAKNEYLDAMKYRCIFEAAERLDVPIYLHPSTPSTAILAGYADYGFLFTGPALGFAADLSLHVMRLIYSGLFDEHPRLKIILGHMGEGLPFWLPRLDFAWTAWWVKARPAIKKKPSDYIKSNITITISGMFFQPAFHCAYEALGADNIAFAVDYPYQDNIEAASFVRGLTLPDSDRDKISYLNAERLLKIKG